MSAIARAHTMSSPVYADALGKEQRSIAERMSG